MIHILLPFISPQRDLVNGKDVSAAGTTPMAIILPGLDDLGVSLKYFPLPTIRF